MADAARRIRQDTAIDLPIVLTDREGGRYLPGLCGARVYAGHWMESPGYENKLREITSAGLDTDPQARPGLTAENVENFDRLLKNTDADYVMIQASLPLAAELQRRSLMPVLYQGSRWIVFRHAPTAKALGS
jgi:hypothetical protein